MIKKFLQLTLILPLVFMTMPVFAAGCIGNILEGTLATDTGGLVYLSAATWDAAYPGNPSSVAFETYYDTANPSAPFSGQAWSETFGWLIFTGSTAYFQNPDTSPYLWGGWDGSMDLSGITYVDPNLSGIATSYALTGGAIDDTDDWWVGAGDIDFSGAFLTGGVGIGCASGEVNLFVNGAPSYPQTGSCPVTTVELTWTSTDVSGCTTDNGPWSPSGARGENELSGESATVSVGDGDTIIFSLNCIDNTDSSTVTGTASVSCNETSGPSGSTGGTAIPDFIET